ncbi:MAG: OmpA family protein [Luteolibacter sp.]|jgi:outer membrane protein OmpA-like peptidoglycan-associated protein|nr:OmpA family protein [Luteolibacter sp.]
MSEQNAPIDEPKPLSGDEETTTISKPAMPPAIALAFVIIALLGVLIVIGLRGGISGSGVDSADLTELQAEANALRSQLNRERIALGLRPLEGNSESVEDIAARLKKDADTMVALAGRFQTMLAEKDAELSAANAENLRLEQLRQTLTAECSRLQSELQRALVSGSDVESLRRDLATVKSQRDALSAELATLRQELAAKGKGVSEDEFAVLERRLEEALRAKGFFEARVAELEGELSKAKLFASSENELLPAAVELVRSIRKLEGKPDAEISSAYSSLGASLGASVLHTLNFATGSSELNPADQDIIRNLISEIPDGDLVLAIGYASETGNVDANRVLSSDRATAAAQLYSSLKRPAQLVQAVYLGQTDRFSSRIPERNQLVEIWRIRKK